MRRGRVDTKRHHEGEQKKMENKVAGFIRPRVIEQLFEGNDERSHFLNGEQLNNEHC
jgi:hypothetical protein